MQWLNWFRPARKKRRRQKLTVRRRELTPSLEVNRLESRRLLAGDIDISGMGNSIADGDTSPTGTDGTSFGPVSVNGANVVHTFQIENAHMGMPQTLNLTNVSVSGTNASDFTVSMQPGQTALTNGQTTTFQISFSASGAGLRSATITVDSDTTTASEQAYTFSVAGTGVASPDVILNELEVDPPGTGANEDFEFVEIAGTHVGNLSDVYFVAVNGNNANAGNVTEAVNLGASSLGGTNNLLVIHETGAGHTLSGTNGLGVTNFDLASSTSASFLLIHSPGSAITTSSDLDIGNDGTLDLPEGARLIDGIGWTDNAADHAYGADAGEFANVPDAATRLPNQNLPLTIGEWYVGELDGAGNQLTYSSPTVGVLTPGAPNVPNPVTIGLDGSNNLVITGDGTVGDFLTLSSDGTTITIADANKTISVSGVTGATGNGTNTVTIPVASITGAGIIINGGGGDDQVTLNFSATSSFGKTVTFNGQGQATATGDTLVVNGTGSFTTATYNYTNLTDGSVVVTSGGAGTQTLNYTGLEPISSTINATNVVLNYSSSTETITVENGTLAGQTKVSSTKGEVTSFNNPTAKLTINGGGGDDTINVNGVDAAFAAAIEINGDGGTGDSVNINTALSLGNGANNGDLTIDAETITISKDIDTDNGTNSGNVAFNNGDVTIAAGVTIDTDGGGTDGTINFGQKLTLSDSLTLKAGAAAVTFGGAVLLGSSNLTVDSSSTTKITAGGGVTGTGNLDIDASTRTDVDAAIALTGSGTVSLERAKISGVNVSTAGGGITFDGATFTDTGAVKISSGPTGGNIAFNDTLTLAGDLTIEGGTGNVTFTKAVALAGNDLNVSSSGTTNITSTSGITGTGNVDIDATTATNVDAAIALSGTGKLNLERAVISGVNLTTSGTDITLQGATSTDTGAVAVSSNVGAGNINFTGAVTLGTALSVTAGTGTIDFDSTINGGAALTANSSAATTFAAAVGAGTALASITTDAGGGTTVNGTMRTTGNQDYADNVTLGAASMFEAANVDFDELVMNGGFMLTVNVSGTGSDAAKTISGAGGLTKLGVGTLRLTGNHLYTGNTIITAGELELSHTSNNSIADSPLIRVNGILDVTNLTGQTLILDAGDTQTLEGTGSIQGNVNAPGTTTVAPGGSGVGDLGLVNFTMQNNSTFDVDITAVATNDQITASGTVDITDATLLLDLNAFSPAAGNTFTILEKTSGGAITGTFKVGGVNIAEGGAFTVGGQSFTISYVGGTGNDVVLTAQGGTETNVFIDGSGDLVIRDVGTNSNDTITIQADVANSRYIITDPGRTLDTTIPALLASRPDANTVYVSFSAITGTKIVLDTLAGNDSVTVDFSLGNFPVPIEYLGGTQSGGGDVLAMSGGAFTNLTFNYTNLNDGSVVADTNSITYVGLEPISSTVTATNVTLNYGLLGETITVTDAGPASTTKVTSTAGEMTSFINPTETLTINAGGGDDTVNVDGFGSGFNAALTINGKADTDVVNINTALTLGSAAVDGDLVIDAETISIDSDISTNAAAATNAGAVTFTGGVTVDSAVSINTDHATGTDGAVSFGDTLTLAAKLTIDAGTADVTFSKAVAIAGNDLTVDSSATTNVTGKITGTTGNVDIDASTATHIDGGIALSGAGTVNIERATISGVDVTTAGGAITFQKATVTDTGAVAVSSGAGLAGDVTFGDTLALGGALTIDAGTGDATITGAATIGANALTIDSSSTSNITAGISGSGSVDIDATTVTNVDGAIAITGTGTVNIENATISGVDITTAGQDITLQGTTTTDTGAVEVSSGALLAGNILFGGAVNLGGALTVNAGTGTATITGLATIGAHNLTIDSSSTATLTGGVSGTTGDVDVDAATATNVDGAITLTGAGTINLERATISGVNVSSVGGAITFQGVTATDTGPVTISSGAAAAGAILFDDTLTLGGNLTIDAGTGTVTFSKAVSILTHDLTVDSSSTTNINLASGITGSTGNVDIDATAGTNVDAAIALSGAGTVNIERATISGVDITTAGGAITLQGATLTDTGAVAISSGAGLGGDVSITGTLGLGAGDLTINAGTGDATITGAATLGANNLTIDSSSTSNITGGISGSGMVDIDATTVTNVDGAITLTGTGSVNIENATISGVNITTVGQDITLQGATATDTAPVAISTGAAMAGNVLFGAGLTLGSNLTVDGGTGTVTLTGVAAIGSNDLTVDTSSTTTVTGGITGTTGSVDIDATTLTDLDGAIALSGSGTVNLERATLAANITTVGGDITLQHATTTEAGATAIGSGAGGGNVLFDNTLLLGDNLTITGGTGNVTLTGAVTLGANNLSVASSDTTNVTAGISGTGSVDIDASTATNVDGAVALTGTGSIDIERAVVSGVNLTTVGQAITLRDSLTTDTGVVTITSGAGAGDILVTGPMLMGANVTVTAGTGAASFNSTIDGGFDLLVNSGGATTFGGVIGGGTALANLTTDAVGTTTIGTTAITTSSDQTFRDAVTMTSATTLTAVDVIFEMTVANGGNLLTVNVTGTVSEAQGVVSGGGGLTKGGTGTFTLSASGNTYTGATTINLGTLQLSDTTSNNNIGASASIILAGGTLDVETMNAVSMGLGSGANAGRLDLQSGQTLSGTGNITGSVTALGGSTISLSSAPGQLTISGDLEMNLNSTFNVNLNSTVAGTGFDQLVVGGDVDVTASSLVLAMPGASFTAGTTFEIVTNNGANAVTGTFFGFLDGYGITAPGGQVFTINYDGGTGNDIVLTAQGAAETSVVVLAGNLIITDINGGVSNDNLTIQVNGAGTHYVISDATLTLTTTGGTAINANTVQVLITDVTGSISFVTLDGDTVLADLDQVTVNLTNVAAGATFADSISYSSVADSATLTITGNAYTDVTHNMTGGGAGNFDLDNDASSDISYTGLSQTTQVSPTDALTVNFNGGADTILLNDDADTVAGRSRLALSTTGTDFNFTDPNNTLTLNLGALGDSLTIDSSLEAGFDPAVTIDGGGGTDVVTNNEDLTLGSGANKGHFTLTNVETLKLNADINTAQGTDAGNVSISGNTVLGADAKVTTDAAGLGVDGNVTFSGTVTNSGNDLNVVADGGAVTFTGQVVAGTGNLTVESSAVTTLTGGIAGSTAMVDIDASTRTDVDGAITLTGAGTVNIERAVVSGVNISTVGGDITLQDVTSTDTGNVLLSTGAGSAGNVNVTGNLTVSNDLTVTAGTGNATLSAKVDGTVAGMSNLTLNSSGTTTLAGIVGGTTSLATVTTDAAGSTDLNGGAVTTTLDQTYNDDVLLGTNNVLTSTALNGDLFFNDTVNSQNFLAFSLTANSMMGQVAFAGSIGQTDPVVNLDVDAGTSVSFAGDVTLTGFLTVDAGTTVMLGGVDFDVDSDNTGDDVAINAAGAITQTAGGSLDSNMGTLLVNSTGAAVMLQTTVTNAGDALASITTSNAGTSAVQIRGTTVTTESVTSTGGDVEMVATTGDVTVNAVVATSQAVYVQASDGSLVDGNNATMNVTAGTLDVRVETNVGTLGGGASDVLEGPIMDDGTADFLETDVSILAIRTEGDDSEIGIHNTDTDNSGLTVSVLAIGTAAAANDGESMIYNDGTTNGASLTVSALTLGNDDSDLGFVTYDGTNLDQGGFISLPGASLMAENLRIESPTDVRDGASTLLSGSTWTATELLFRSGASESLNLVTTRLTAQILAAGSFSADIANATTITLESIETLSGAIDIDSTTAGTDVVVQRVVAGGGGAVSLDSEGTLNDDNTVAVGVIGGAVTLDAVGEIGNAGNRLQVTSNSLNVSTTSAVIDGAQIFLEDVGGTNLADIDTVASDISIISDGDLTVGSVHAGTTTLQDVTINNDAAAGDRSINASAAVNGVADIIGGIVTLTAKDEIGGTSQLEITATALDVSTTNPGDDLGAINLRLLGSLTNGFSTDLTDIDTLASNVTIQANDNNVLVGVIDAGTATEKTVTIHANLGTFGLIFDTQVDAVTDITAAVIDLRAIDSIGLTTGDRLELDTDRLWATSVNSSIFLSNVSASTVIANVAALAGGQDVHLSTSGSLVLEGGIQANNTVMLNVGGTVTDGGDAGVDLFGSGVDIVSDGSVGTAANPLDTDLFLLNVNTRRADLTGAGGQVRVTNTQQFFVEFDVDGIPDAAGRFGGIASAAGFLPRLRPTIVLFGDGPPMIRDNFFAFFDPSFGEPLTSQPLVQDQAVIPTSLGDIFTGTGSGYTYTIDWCASPDADCVTRVVFEDQVNNPPIQTVTMAAPFETPTLMQTYVANPNPNNDQAVIQALLTVSGPSDITLVDLSIPDNPMTPNFNESVVSSNFVLFQFAPSGFSTGVFLPPADIVVDPPVFSIPEAVVNVDFATVEVSQATEGPVGQAATGRQTSREYVLRVVTEDDTEVDVEDIELPPDVLTRFSEIIKKLNDDHYKIYLKREDGSEELVKDFIIIQGKVIDQENIDLLPPQVKEGQGDAAPPAADENADQNGAAVKAAVRGEQHVLRSETGEDLQLNAAGVITRGGVMLGAGLLASQRAARRDDNWKEDVDRTLQNDQRGPWSRAAQLLRRAMRRQKPE